MVSINCLNPSGSNAEPPSVTYLVTFSEPVTNVVAGDFGLSLSGVTVSAPLTVTPTSGYNTTYQVTVSGISGNGVLGLNLLNTYTINNAVGNHLINLSATFATEQAFSSGASSTPECVASGDFNGDGKMDLVTANLGSNTVGVLLGNGDGTFQAVQTYATGSWPWFVTTADLNGDGKLDLIVANRSSNTISILLGNGDGTFQAQRTIAVGSIPFCVAVGDFNGDGKPDLAVTNASNNTLSVLLGNGDGTFGTAKTFATGTYPISLVTADLNGDGKLDLVAANGDSNSVSVLLGNGDGTFQTHRDYAVGSDPDGLAVADFNDDGKLDLVASNDGSDSVSVLLGNGDGTFQAQQTYSVFSYPDSVTVADVSGDGIPDLLLATPGNDDVAILLGNGDGTFATEKVASVGTSDTYAIAADLNGDGLPDLIATAGSQVRVCDGSGGITGQTYTVQQPTRLVFTKQPASTSVGGAIDASTGIQVSVVNSVGSTVAGDSSPVTLTLSGGDFASGASTVTVAAVGGVATFSNLAINAPGHYTLTATDGSLTSATSSSFTIFGPAAQLVFTQQPTTIPAGLAFNPALTVAVEDSTGDIVLDGLLLHHADPQHRNVLHRLQHRHARRVQRRGNLQQSHDHHPGQLHAHRHRRVAHRRDLRELCGHDDRRQAGLHHPAQ